MVYYHLANILEEETILNINEEKGNNFNYL